jgi:hypothetical protein
MQGMTRSLMTFVLGAVLGTGLGMALVAFLRAAPPTQPAMVVAAVAPAAPEATAPVFASGKFVQADPNDPIHKGAGRVSILGKEIVLDADFQVSPGPEFHVLLVPKPAIRASADVANTMYIDLGPLRAFKGAQTYPISDGVDLAAYPSVVIWSRTYSALISPADLSFAKPGA